jgi:hypothetical protein
MNMLVLNIIVKPHYQRKGRPRPGDEVSHYTYQIQSNLCENLQNPDVYCIQFKGEEICIERMTSETVRSNHLLSRDHFVHAKYTGCCADGDPKN